MAPHYFSFVLALEENECFVATEKKYSHRSLASLPNAPFHISYRYIWVGQSRRNHLVPWLPWTQRSLYGLFVEKSPQILASCTPTWLEEPRETKEAFISMIHRNLLYKSLFNSNVDDFIGQQMQQPFLWERPFRWTGERILHQVQGPSKSYVASY